MAFFSNLGRALRSVWQTITSPESPPEPVDFEEEPGYEEPTPEYDQGPFGDFFGGGEEPPTNYPGGGTGYDDDRIVYHAGDGPYPFSWDEDMVTFWDSAMDGSVYEDESYFERAQDLFTDGYIKTNDQISTQERMAAREQFLYEMDMAEFDWEAFREYHGYSDEI